MTQRTRRTPWMRARLTVGAALAGAAALTLSACGSDAGTTGSGPSGSSEVVGYVAADSADAGEPVPGGRLTFGSYSFPQSLDPVVTQVAGSNGGTELAAIYDLLVRQDGETGEYLPQLAESMEVDDAGTAWRFTLPAGATFSDGSALDAAAAAASLDRFADSYASGAQTWNRVVDEVIVDDDRTFTVALTEPWEDFPALLTMGAGMIVAPSAGDGEDFTPIGAGAFTVEEFSPERELMLTAREDRHTDRALLDTVRFVPTDGARTQLDEIVDGQLDATYILRDPVVLTDVEQAGLPGYRDLQGQGAIAFINQREGRPGEDLRVRRAIALAIDPETIDQRSSEGAGPVSATMFPEGSPWHSEVEGPQPDPDTARTLLDEAKADGYDGHLTYVTLTEPTAQSAALAAQAMLEQVGFTVTVDSVPSVAALVQKIYLDNDFDIARGGLNLIDAAPYMRLYDGLGAESEDNASGYDDAQTDALLEELLVAEGDDEKQDVIDRIQERVTETVPYLVWAPAQVRLVWSDAVHGMNRSLDGIVLLDRAWVQR